MLQRSGLLSVVMAAVCTTAAVARRGWGTAERGAWLGSSDRPVAGLRRLARPRNERLKIRVPGTPHVLSAEVPQLPMNAPLVVRRVRGDFTASVHVLGRLEPGRSKTTLLRPVSTVPA